MLKLKAFIRVGALVALASSAFAQAGTGVFHNKSVASVKFIAPGNILLIWTKDGGYYRYMSNASGNSFESCKALLSIALAAFTTGNNINISVVADNLGVGDPDDINAIDIRTPE